LSQSQLHEPHIFTLILRPVVLQNLDEILATKKTLHKLSLNQLSLYQIDHIFQVDVSEDDVIRAASREKVLEMYGTSKIEAIPLSNQAEGREQGSEENGTEPRLPANTEPSSGRLFLPSSLKRSERHPNPAVGQIILLFLK
jgi:hypothetical protein